MPFVQRDRSGKISGLYANPQPQPDGTDLAPEELPEDHLEVIAFHNAHPIPPSLLRPLTPEEMSKLNQEHDALQGELQRMNNLRLTMLNSWADLEIALSALLHEILCISPRGSHIAYAVYYAPNSAEARSRLVDNALARLLTEQEGRVGYLPDLQVFRTLWSESYGLVGAARKTRNIIAHLTPLIVAARGKKWLRLTAPAFDVINVGEKVSDGQVPGFSVAEIEMRLSDFGDAQGLVDSANRTVVEMREGSLESFQRQLALLRTAINKVRDRKGKPHI